MKRTPGTTVAEREAYWEEEITKARAYPKGVTAYCISRKISKNNYYQWFKRLRPNHPEWAETSRPTKSSSQSSKPEIEVSEKAKRRTFNAEYKAKILQQTDQAPEGKVAAILRKEGLYTSHLQKWRLERDRAALSANKRGPKTNPLTAENHKLKAELARLQKQLRQASVVIELQKKVSEILGISLHSEEY